tara:strand:+ start:129 stop:773 length:645 start_codon:yes stop_codon:yes gene_type:complete
MSDYTGYVCVVRNKDTKAYGIFPSFDVEEKFEDIGVGDKNELIMNYWVLDNFGVTNKFHKIFEEKRITQSDYLVLNEKDLEEIKTILEEEKKYTDIAIKQDGDAFWLQKFKERREKYSKASDLKKFFMRHNNKLNIALGFGFFFLILFPVIWFFIVVLGAIGISKYFLAILYLVFISFLLWSANKEDKYEQENLLQDEKEIIKQHRKWSKNIEK